MTSDLCNLRKNNGNKLSVMVVGDYAWPWYQEACALALESNGCDVYRFSWFDDFKHWQKGSSEPTYKSFFHRLGYRFQFGPHVNSVSRRLIKQSKEIQPDIVWFYNVHLLGRFTLKKLRKVIPNSTFVQYSNDDPFSPQGTTFLWRKFIASIPLFDKHFVYRHKNLRDFKSHGIDNSSLLRAYFIPEEDYHVPQHEVPDAFKCDVVFAGHYEDDGRIDMLESICNEGFKLNLYGGGWDNALHKLHENSPLRKLFPIKPVTGDDYRHAICGAKVALCFLSTINHDTYTRRSFQIPAMKTAMLSVFTQDLSELYEEDKEVMFFRDKEQLLKNLNKMISNEDLRNSLSEAAHKRVYKDGHDIVSRMKYFIEQVKLDMKEKI